MIKSAVALERHKKTHTYQQIKMFTQRIKSAYLVAWDSPRKAFYRIWIEAADDDYIVVKESGIQGKVLDRRCWPAEDEDAALTMFDRRIKAKTNPDRKSPRKYTIVYNI